MSSNFSFSDNSDRNYDFKKHGNGYHWRKGNITIFPNPTSSYLQISNLDEGIYHFQIYNQLGQVVLFDALDLEINVSSLNAGYYWITVMEDDGSMVAKKSFIKN